MFIVYLSNTNTLFGVCHVVVGEVLDGNVTRYTIVKTQSDACCRAWAATSVKVVPHFRELWKVIFQAERTLPETSLIILHWISLIQLIPLWLPGIQLRISTRKPN